MTSLENHCSPDDHRRTDDFVCLMGENERSLRIYVLSLVPSWDDADEIVQQVRVRIWEQFHDYDPDKSFGAWSRAIAYYLILSHREKMTRSPQMVSKQFLEAVSEHYIATPPAITERETALRHCLEKLDEPNFQLIERHYSGKETMRQIGTQLGVSHSAVKQRMMRIRGTLAKCIERTLRRRGLA